MNMTFTVVAIKEMMDLLLRSLFVLF